jgi:hypothetical protein
MRRLSPAVLALTVAVVAGSTARAQVVLVPGPPTVVSRNPKDMAAADFNGDGIDDAAVCSPLSNKVSILLGDADGVFRPGLDFPMGRSPKGIVARDLNQDGLPDIAVASPLVAKGVFIAYGVGNGTFQTPFPTTASRYTNDLAAGNMDKQNGLDLFALTRLNSSFALLLNQGGNRGFAVGGNFKVGKGPKHIVAKDVNGDGFDDIITLNTRSAGSDDASVLINNGLGSFATPNQFLVGANGKDLVVVDVNSDGAPDIIVLNGATTVNGIGHILRVHVLLNQTTLQAGRVVGTGIFIQTTPVALTCPTSLGGVPIACIPSAIAAADFDQDGFTDFAVDFVTEPEEPQTVVQTSGLVSAYSGNGDGSFDFATQITIGSQPTGLVTGDFTGDGFPDLAVGEQLDSDVRILRSVKPALRANSFPCNVGTQCDSNHCVDNVCCDSAVCPAGQFCNIPGSKGVCSPPGDPGSTCAEGQQCASPSFCVDGYCCSTSSCPDGQYCNTGDCAPPSVTGTQCNDDPQCSSGFCTDGFCCGVDRCPAGQYCNIPGVEGQCSEPAPVGAPCAVSGQCQSTFCVDGACCGVDSCPAGESCNVPGAEGVCHVLPTATATATATVTPTRTPTSTLTPTPQPNGASCSAGTQCVSLACADGVCCDLPAGTAECPTGQRCNITGSLGTCAPPKNIGGECTQDSDCTTGNCDPSTVPPRCAVAKTSTPTATRTPTPTATPLANGDNCLTGPQCASGNCLDGVCCDSAGCPQDQFCNVPGSEGTCATPRPEPGQSCDPNATDPCDPGFFCNPDNPDDPVCCETETCPEGDRCDIFGFMGQCAPPLPEGSECEDNLDCEPGLLCLRDPSPSTQYFCRVPPFPTPTLIPTPQPSVTAGIRVQTSRSGGCSISDEPSRSGVWLLALPLVLWVRRRYAPQAAARQE